MKNAVKIIGKSFLILLLIASLVIIGIGLATSIKIKPAKIIEIGYNLERFDNNPLNIEQCRSGDDVIFYPVEKPGYEFQYWTYADSTGNGLPVNRISNIQKSVVMRAVFKPIVYKAYMHIDDDIAYTIDFTANVDIELGGAIKSGYKFAGWMDEDGRIVSMIRYGTVGDRHYTAVWDAN